MSTTQPIRNLEELERLKEYFQKTCPNQRNYLLIQMGVNTALRISDLLSLTWEDVYDFYLDSFRSHITVIEHKTGKRNKIALNAPTLEALACYKEMQSPIKPCHYLFYGRKKDAPLSRCQAFRIIRNASEKLHFEEPVSCHSLRKTFGYHAWKSGVPSVLIMDIYNHSSFQVTKHYLGIDQDDKDTIFLKLQL